MYLPHWIVNGQRTSSQFDAWKAARAIGTKPHFYFYEEEYDKLDWTTEPTESWDQLCLERCTVLRQRYQKLSLFYSAGRDSHHILRCFYHFNIPLDELVLLNLKTNPVRQNELITLIYPQVMEYLKAFPNTKIRTVDVGPDEFDLYFKDDWLEKPASALIHGYFQPTNFSFYVKQILHADEPNHGIILGVDKPRIIIEDGKYYSTVIDKTIETFLTDIPNIEFFYYSPEMPKIHLKQTWMMLNHIERTYGTQLLYTPDQIDPLLNSKLGSSPNSFSITAKSEQKITTDITNDFLKEYCGNSHSEYYDDYCISCGRGAAWNVNLAIQNGKSKHKLNGREPVFQNVLKFGLENKWKAANNFIDAMGHLKSEYETIFNNSDPYQGTLGVYSKKYYMKDVT
jgi:hypothetical protein